MRTKLKCYCLSLLVILSPLVHSDQITAYTEILAPYQLKDESDKLTGLSVEVFEELASIVGDTPNIQPMSWARAYKKALKEPNSVIFSIARNKKREDKFLWVGSIVINQSYFWGLRQSFEGQHLSFEQIKEHGIVVSRDSNGHAFLNQLNFPNVYPVVYENQVIHMVNKGRVDFLMSSAPTLEYLANNLDIDFKRFIPVHKIEGRSTALSIAFNIDSDDTLVAKYQKAFQELKTSGKLTELRKKWGVSSIDDLSP